MLEKLFRLHPDIKSVWFFSVTCISLNVSNVELGNFRKIIVKWVYLCYQNVSDNDVIFQFQSYHTMKHRLIFTTSYNLEVWKMIQIIKSSKNLNFLIYTHNMIIWLSQGCRNYFSMHINLGKTSQVLSLLPKNMSFQIGTFWKVKTFLIINS